MDPRTHQNPQEPFVLESRTNRKPSLRTNHFSNHLYWMHVHNQLVSLCTPWAVCTPTTFRLRSVYVPSTFRLRSVLMLSLLCLFHRLRSNVCVPLHAFHDMPSNAFRHMRPSVCFQLHVFNCMRSTRCVPLYAFHCVSSTMLSEYTRSTTCVPRTHIHYIRSTVASCDA